MDAVAGLPKSRWSVIVVRPQREGRKAVLLVDDMMRVFDGRFEMTRDDVAVDLERRYAGVGERVSVSNC